MKQVLNSLYLAKQSLARQQIQEALVHAEAALRENPESQEATWLAAVVNFQAGRAEKARSRVKALLERGQQDVADISQQYLLLGLAASQAGYFAEAREAFETLLLDQPDHTGYIAVLARLAYAQGDGEAAASYARRFFSLLSHAEPAEIRAPLVDIGKTAYDCSLFADAETAAPWLAVLESALERAGIDPGADASLQFGLAKLNEACAELATALRHYRAGNALQRRASGYELQTDIKALESTRQQYGREFFQRSIAAEPREGEPRPLFIVGMPRSGSSLVEQVLAAHPSVLACGERDWLHEAFREVLTRRSEEAGRVLTAGEFDAAMFAEIREAYFRRAGLPPGTAVFTDKMPGNIYKLGVLLKAFPDAAVVITEREKLATVMSCFTTAFAAGLHFTEDLADCARMYDETRSLADHWTNCVPEAVLRLDYQQFVEAPRTGIDALLDFCGLERHSACYEPHKVERAVGTSSNLQVREPIHADTNARWAGYLEHLDHDRALF